MKKLLVCIDGSLYGQVCTQYALWLSKHTGAQVEFLYVSELWQFEAPLVADFGGSLGAQPYMGLTAQLQEIEREKLKLLSEYVYEVFEKAGLRARVSFNHRTGVLVDAVEEFESGEEPVDLVIFGKRGEGANMAKLHLGSNMERVVRASKRPSFIANREFIEPSKILLAYDGSESADKALNWYADNSGKLGNVELHVITIAKQGEEDKASAHLKNATAQLDAKGLKATYQMLNGVPADAIANYQNAQGINLLLMGAYGHSRIRQLLIGSTTTEVLQRCRIPTLLFR